MLLRNSSKLKPPKFLEPKLYRTNAVPLKTEEVPVASPPSGSAYQYIEESSLPTKHFQSSLLRLPIPKLEDTCYRYLKSIKNIVDSDCYNETKKLVDRFRENEAVALQESLIGKDKKNKHTSYISQPWYNMYLENRDPLILNFNPGIVFNESIHPSIETQLCKATNFTISSLRFWKSLKNDLLSPEVFHLNPGKTNTPTFTKTMKLLPSIVSSYGAYIQNAYPLDMSQYPMLFNTCRIPQEEKDGLLQDESGKHVLVMRNGHFFTMKVFNENGDILPPQDIYTCFKYILDQNLNLNENVAILTTENRDVWARSREHLISISKENVDALKAVESAILLVCLDNDWDISCEADTVKPFLLGDSGYNRWYDKSLSLIITSNPMAGINFEHSWGDGVAVVRYMKDTFLDINTNPFVDIYTEVSKISPGDYVKEFNFKVDERILSDMGEAKKKFQRTCNSFKVCASINENLGRKQCQKYKISPDSLCQLVFQIAFHKVFGKFVSTYESCSTAAFKHGRTETIRPCTELTCKVAKNINHSSPPSKSELLSLIQQCSEFHKKLTKEAAMGQGFDRHLFALKNMSYELNLPLPDIFKDSSYKSLNYNVLSTSTLNNEAILSGGFGAVVPDGLGIGYKIMENESATMVSYYEGQQKGKQFLEAVNLTYKELEKILCD